MTDNQTPDAEALRHLVRIYWPDSGGQAAVVRDRALQAALVSKIEQHYSDVSDRAEKAEAEVARVEALAEDWERMAAEDAPEDPEAARWFRYAARNVRGRLREPTAALAEPERDEEPGA